MQKIYLIGDIHGSFKPIRNFYQRHIQLHRDINNCIDKFLICLFLIPSCCQVNLRMKLAVRYPFLGDISKEDMISILDAFELVDIERLVGICNKTFFKEKKELTHDEFIKMDFTQAQKVSQDFVEKNMIFLGLLIVQNKLKKATKASIQTLDEAHLRMVMATGDNILTAISVSKE